jgi:putative phosphoribosyl transferase
MRMPSVHGFQDRRHAGRLLAAELAGMPLTRPLGLAIPRGGIDLGVEIARSLNAELDVVLARSSAARFSRNSHWGRSVKPER